MNTTDCGVTHGVVRVLITIGHVLWKKKDDYVLVVRHQHQNAFSHVLSSKQNPKRITNGKN
jgi:hypothetical protein